MKAAIYNPYLDTLGGGERYTISFAKVLSSNNYEVDIQWKDTSIKQSLEKRFGIDLKEINIIKDIKRGDGYDLCFWLSDGSIPLLHARNNFLHFQIPFREINGKSLINRMKMLRINAIICNSKFTKKFIDKEYGVNSIVIYPPIDTERIKPKRKENIILSVGRFSQLTQAKKQEILIFAFKKLFKSGINDWSLILAGGSEIGGQKYLVSLKKTISDYPIEIIENPSFKILKDYFGKAKIYWSASGFGIDENKEPHKVEHFGIAVVEAMAAKVIPLVYSAGGHKEIIQNSKNGFLWTKVSQLTKLTNNLIKNNYLLINLRKESYNTSLKFNLDNFSKKVAEIL